MFAIIVSAVPQTGIRADCGVPSDAASVLFLQMAFAGCAADVGDCCQVWRSAQTVNSVTNAADDASARTQMALGLLAVSSGLLYYYLNKEDRDRNRNLGPLPAYRFKLRRPLPVIRQMLLRTSCLLPCRYC